MITLFEKYTNSINNSIIDNYKEDSNNIINIINSYENIKDAKIILEKISFIIESIGDVKTYTKNDKELYYYINTMNKKDKTFIFDIKKEKFIFSNLFFIN